MVTPWFSTLRARALVAGSVVLAISGCSGPAAPRPSAIATPDGRSAPAATATAGAAPTPTAAAHYGLNILAFDRDGKLLGTDCHAARILELEKRGPKVIAGSGPGEFAAGFGGDGGLATAAQFQCPIGIVVGEDGTIYFADHGNNRIRAINTGGVISTIAGSGPTGTGFGSYSGDGGPAIEATLQEPTFLLLDPDGNLYVSDRDNNRVRRIAANGTITTVAGNGENAFSGDGGMAIDAALDDPAGLAMDARGNLYISDSNNERIRIVDRKGRIRTFAGTGSMSSDGDGKTGLKASFADPEGIALAPDGMLYISEGEGNRIRAIAPDGTVSTFAGTGEVGNAGDGGPATSATLSVGGSPGGILLDGQGNLYIPDTGNRCVRMVDPSGIITTFLTT